MNNTLDLPPALTYWQSFRIWILALLFHPSPTIYKLSSYQLCNKRVVYRYTDFEYIRIRPNEFVSYYKYIVAHLLFDESSVDIGSSSILEHPIEENIR